MSLLVLGVAATTPGAVAAPPDSGCAGTLLRADTGAVVTGADRIRGESVNAVLADGRGGWYVGGNFRQVGSLARRNLAHLDGNGRADPGFAVTVDGRVTALALAGGTLYLAGEFRLVGDAHRAGLAAVDARTGRPTGWQPRPGLQPDEIEVVGKTVYVGSSDSIVAVDARTGAVQPSGFPAGSPFAVGGGTAVAKGGSGYYGPLLGFGPASPSPDARGYFSAVVTTRNRVLATGRFATQATRHVGLAAWSRSGRPLWRAAVGAAYVNALALSGKRVYVGGLLSSLGGVKRPRLGAVDVRTGGVLPWTPSIDGTRWTPLALAATSSRVFVGSAVTAPGADLPACARP